MTALGWTRENEPYHIVDKNLGDEIKTFEIETKTL